MTLGVYIIIFVLAFIFLAISGSMLVKSLTSLARFFNLSEYVIAFILMSFATSVPELFVGISSAIGNISNFSFGNILGSNFINITLVIGLVALFKNGLKVESKISRRNFWVIFFIAFMPILLAIDGTLSRGDGLVLILSFAIYIIALAGEREYFTKAISEFKFNIETVIKVFRNMRKFFLGILILLASSAVLVWSGEIISNAVNVGILSFGVIVVALGTTLPELVFGVRASMLKHESMTIGNSVGSIAFNSAFIVGIVSLINPIHIQNVSGFLVAAIFLFVALLLFNIFIYRRLNISRNEGALLVLLYILFIVVEYLQII